MNQHVIHQIWMQGWDKLPEKYVANVKSVIDLNPNWQHIKWDESMIRKVVALLGDAALAKYDSFTILHQKIDYGRYAILYTYGGVSVDIDAVALKGFDATPCLSTSDFIVSENSSGKFINNATIFLSAKNPLMLALMDSIDPICKKYQSDFSCVLQSTGPFAFTRFVKDNPGITVLDHKYFEPCSGSDSNCVVGPDAILDHRHEKSWMNPLFKVVSEQYFRMKPYKNVFIVLIILLILFFFVKGLKK